MSPVQSCFKSFTCFLLAVIRFETKSREEIREARSNFRCNNMLFLVLFLILTVEILSMENFFNEDAFSRVLHENIILKGSFFAANFSTPDLLQLDVQNENIGVQYSGQETENRLKLLFEKVKSGRDVHLLVIGGSSSLGADLGYHSSLQTFHAAFVSWWDEVVYPHTNSRLHNHNVAIGGVGTAYMSHCWEQYVKEFLDIDLLFWEFFINDFFYSEYDKNLKLFISSVLEYRNSKPAPIFVKFGQSVVFPGEKLTCFVPSADFKQKTQVVKENIELFRISAIDIQHILCDNIKKKKYDLSKHKYFISHHPSHLAHAQIGYSLINYVRKIFINFLNFPSTPGNDLTSRTMMNVNFFKESFRNPQCFTALLPYPNFPIPSIFKLPLLWHYGYRARTKSKWNHSLSLRNDVRGGYMAKMPFASIGFKLDQSIVYKASKIYLVISHQEHPTQFNIIVTVKTDNREVHRSYIDCSKVVHPTLSVEMLASNVYGDIQVEIDDPLGKCLLNAIIVE